MSLSFRFHLVVCCSSTALTGGCPSDTKKSYLAAGPNFGDKLKVHRIVPAREQLNDSDELKSLMEYCDGAVMRFAPENYTDVPKPLAELFGKALDAPKFKSIADSGQMEVLVNKGGQAQIKDWEFLHIDKIGPSVYEELAKRGMIRQLELNSHWKSVPCGVGGLVLSMLASQIALSRGFDAITDQPLAFALNGMYGCTSDSAGVAEGIIASALATVYVPKNIALLTPKEYAELRKCNSDVRQEFAKMVGELKANSRLNRITDPAKFRSELDDIVVHVGEEMVKFRKSRIATKINNWVPLTLTSVVPVAVGFAFSPVPAAAAATFSFGVSAIAKLTYKASQFNYPKVLQTLCVADAAAAKVALRKFV